MAQPKQIQQLAIFHTDNVPHSMQQTAWAQSLNPILKVPLLYGVTFNTTPTNASIKGLALVSGANTIYHNLGRPVQGWLITRFHGGWAQIFDTQDTNANAARTLLLTTSAAVTVSIYIF